MDKKNGRGKRTVKDLSTRKDQVVEGGAFNAYLKFGGRPS